MNYIRKKFFETNIEYVTEVNIKQSFWDRTLNLGDIQINIQGDNFTEITLFGVIDPVVIRNRIKNLAEDRINVNIIMQKIKKIEEE